MYSFSPSPIIDSLNNHEGFYSVAVICAIIFAFVILTWFMQEVESVDVVKATLWILVIIGFSAYVSWNSGSIIRPTNEVVIGKLAGFLAEGERFTERLGKTTVTRENHFTYVIYEINGNKTMFRASTGITYPETAVIYKN